MSVRRVLVVLLSCVLLLGAWPVAARGATPADSPTAGAARLDLAAMVPTPDDLGAPGYLIDYGRSQSLEELAAELAAQRDSDVAQETAALRQGGFVRKYFARYIVLGTADGGRDRIALVGVNEYVDAATAADGLHAQLGADAGPGVADLAAPALGDTAGVRQIADVALGGDVYQVLLVAFQSGPLVAHAYLLDRGQTAVDPARGEALGATFLARIERVRQDGGPGIGDRALRVTSGHAVQVTTDNYLKLDGQLFRWRDDSDDDFARRSVRHAEGIDGYQFDANLGSQAALTTFVERFPDVASASRWVGSTHAAQAAALGASTMVEVVAGAPAVGDESVALRLQDRSGGWAGYAIAVRVGALVGGVAIVAAADLPLASATALAVAQADCLRAEACPVASLLVGDAIAALMVAATPVASPPAGAVTATATATPTAG